MIVLTRVLILTSGCHMVASGCNVQRPHNPGSSFQISCICQPIPVVAMPGTPEKRSAKEGAKEQETSWDKLDSLTGPRLAV